MIKPGLGQSPCAGERARCCFIQAARSGRRATCCFSEAARSDREATRKAGNTSGAVFSFVQYQFLVALAGVSSDTSVNIHQMLRGEVMF